jgi:hypothetical protein
MRLADVGNIEKRVDHKMWMEWLDFRDYQKDKRKVADRDMLRGIVINPEIITPIILK